MEGGVGAKIKDTYTYTYSYKHSPTTYIFAPEFSLVSKSDYLFSFTFSDPEKNNLSFMEVRSSRKNGSFLLVLALNSQTVLFFCSL